MEERQRLWTYPFVLAIFISLCSNTLQQMSNGTLAVYIDSVGGQAGFSGLLAVVFAIASITFRVISGHLFDKVGGRYIIVIGGILYAAASLLYPILPVLWLTLVLRFLQGIGYSSIGTSANAVAAKVTPPSRIGEGMSYVGVMAALGSAIGPTLGVYIWRVSGSPAIFFALAFVAVVIVIAALTSGLERPREHGRTPLEDGKERLEHQEKISFAQLRPGVSAITLLIALPQSFILTYIILYGDYCGCVFADYFFLISACAMVLARVFFGKSYDRYGVRRTFIPAVVLGITAIVLLWWVPTNAGFLTGAILYGISYGVATPVLTAESVRLAPEDKKGSAVAVYYIGYDLGIGLGALLWGIMIDNFGYNSVFLTSVLVLTIAIWGSVYIEKPIR